MIYLYKNLKRVVSQTLIIIKLQVNFDRIEKRKTPSKVLLWISIINYYYHQTI